MQEVATGCQISRPISRVFFLWLRVLILGGCPIRIETTFEAGNALILGDSMQWTAPAFEEVCLNCEINSYVSAKL
jgi:coenzyme PQQ precursor peptide PqqA